MSKEEISRSYMERQKEIFKGLPLRKARHAVVIGSDQKRNIGAEIAKAMNVCFEADVEEYDEDTLDVTKPIPRAVFDGKDILVLANGLTELAWFEDFDDMDIRDIFAVNVVGSLMAAKSFVKATISARYKKYIVFIGSMAYRNVLNGSAPYCAAKAALAHASRCLAWELAPKGYNVFCVHPSNTLDTPMTDKTIQGLMEYRQLSRSQAEAYWGAVCPKDRFLTKREIAVTVCNLVMGSSDYMSGSQIELAGGQR